MKFDFPEKKMLRREEQRQRAEIPQQRLGNEEITV